MEAALELRADVNGGAVGIGDGLNDGEPEAEAPGTAAALAPSRSNGRNSCSTSAAGTTGPLLATDSPRAPTASGHHLDMPVLLVVAQSIVDEVSPGRMRASAARSSSVASSPRRTVRRSKPRLLRSRRTVSPPPPRRTRPRAPTGRRLRPTARRSQGPSWSGQRARVTTSAAPPAKANPSASGRAVTIRPTCSCRGLSVNRLVRRTGTRPRHDARRAIETLSRRPQHTPQRVGQR